MQKEVITL